MKINIGEIMSRRALLSPDKEALVCEEERLTFSELNRRANRLAQAMLALGVSHGDRVGILALNESEYFDMLFGLGKIGAILVPINYRLAGPEIEYILSDCEAKVFLFGPEYVDIVDSFRESIPAKELIAISDTPPDWAKSYKSLVSEVSDEEPEITGGDDDTLTILYTSGTTGRPKGAELTHSNYFYASVTMVATLGDLGDTTLVALPLFHIGALGGIPMFVHQGARVVLLRNFDPKRFLELIQEEKITGFGSVPALLSFLKVVPDFEKYDWSSIKIILVYAAPVPVTLLKEYAAAGIEVRQLYGLTECCTGTVLDAENALSKAGSCGQPFFHIDVRLIDDQGQDIGPDELGEVLLRGPVVMKGYWNRPEATAETIRDGWLYTGDIAKMDTDGFLYIMDRKKDMIISGGENIYPAEIEDSLLAHPKIQDVGVIGYSDTQWGESVKAVVVLNEGEKLTEEELIEWCQGKIGKYKIPKKVVFADSIPRTPTGKILKRVLRDQYN
ncbi:MAG: long-chain fatty acid--CoA ligase [Deltaproteobacteria bacterium]|nr:long-chain fatty acid--CoA ligase [Deltaproteobacteria bacterium]MBW2050932.1 long-chain fatty acid--CoA ligase [Deltaproteobacteria bacterium]MBW2141187.1 long-chain fatty acid--CoA ligase [Deltaproteobacteria bacterium]MBW2323695.1 long-chain fatty acid--CoA ligase [Deltaproteobacteria bacterium]